MNPLNARCEESAEPRLDSITIGHVNAFTQSREGGNPAGVCLLGEPREAAWMQAVARRVGFSDTAYLVPAPPVGAGACFALRWFTPAAEVPLCGHATLASAHALWEKGLVERDAGIAFQTASGALICRRDGDWIEMALPAAPPEPAPKPAGLDGALGLRVRDPWEAGGQCLVLLESPRELRAMRPDFAALKSIGHRGYIVTSFSDDPRYDFLSRYFAPSLGVDEDPVTGSAHCVLGPFWARLLQKSRLNAWQASSRGGHLKLRVTKPVVYLAGQAVTVGDQPLSIL